MHPTSAKGYYANSLPVAAITGAADEVVIIVICWYLTICRSWLGIFLVTQSSLFLYFFAIKGHTIHCYLYFSNSIRTTIANRNSRLFNFMVRRYTGGHTHLAKFCLYRPARNAMCEFRVIFWQQYWLACLFEYIVII